jgi:hypothetical protein
MFEDLGSGFRVKGGKVGLGGKRSWVRVGGKSSRVKVSG